MKRALAGFNEVSKVDFSGPDEQFAVIYHAEKPLAAEMKKAVEAAVIAPGARKILGDIGSKQASEKR